MVEYSGNNKDNGNGTEYRKFRKNATLRHVVLAFVISLFIFTAGFFIGYSFNTQKINLIDERINELKTETENMQLELMYLDTMGVEHTCPIIEAESSNLLKKLSTFGEQLTNYQNSKDFGSRFNEIKDTYMFLQLRTWLIQKRLKKDCNSDTVSVIYFYSSENCSLCKSQGFILSYFKQELQSRLMVFSLDVEWNQPMMNALKLDFNVTDTPSLVVDGHRRGFTSKEELQEILCGEYKEKPDFCNASKSDSR